MRGRRDRCGGSAARAMLPATPGGAQATDGAGNAGGYTLIEVVVVISIIALISAITTPAMMSWRLSLNASQSAKNVLDKLRETRSRTMNSGLQHEMLIDVPNRRYKVRTGSVPHSYNTTSGEFDAGSVVQDWVLLPKGLIVKSGVSNVCSDSTAVVRAQFNGDGTARLEAVGAVQSTAPVVICIQGSENDVVHRISMSRYGRISLD